MGRGGKGMNWIQKKIADLILRYMPPPRMTGKIDERYDLFIEELIENQWPIMRMRSEWRIAKIKTRNDG